MGKTIVKPQSQTFVCGREDKKGEGVGRVGKRPVGASGLLRHQQPPLYMVSVQCFC